MKTATKDELLKRLRRAEGQMAAIRRMVDEDEGCVDVLLQISAVRGALGKAGQVLLGSHLETCVSDALTSGDAEERRHQVDDLMKIFGRFGGITAR
ncbi:MAG: metal-sensitive transcriptional regulator [Acidobacteriota bacterium]|nr:metal-sensitive transcriptional regulator [Acidobacteriota bacterium]MDH3523012.1 metal-sensitive transcriptional regulator [Acidobacteriota bacterium]